MGKRFDGMGSEVAAVRGQVSALSSAIHSFLSPLVGQDGSCRASFTGASRQQDTVNHSRPKAQTLVSPHNALLGLHHGSIYERISAN